MPPCVNLSSNYKSWNLQRAKGQRCFLHLLRHVKLCHRWFPPSSRMYLHWCLSLRCLCSVAVAAFHCMPSGGPRPVSWNDDPGRSRWQGSCSCWGRPSSRRTATRFVATATDSLHLLPRAASWPWWLWKRWRVARTPQRPWWWRGQSWQSACGGLCSGGLQLQHSACWDAQWWCCSRTLWWGQGE